MATALLRATGREVTAIRPKHLRRVVLETYKSPEEASAMAVVRDLTLRPTHKSPTVRTA